MANVPYEIKNISAYERKLYNLQPSVKPNDKLFNENKEIIAAAIESNRIGNSFLSEQDCITPENIIFDEKKKNRVFILQLLF